MGGHGRMIRLAPQNVDRPAYFVSVFLVVGEQRSCHRLRYAPPRLILVKGALERPQKQITFCAVGIYNSESRVRIAIRRSNGLTNRRNIGRLPAKNEELPGLNFQLWRVQHLLQTAALYEGPLLRSF